MQDEIIKIAADLIRDHFRKCLEICPHYTVIADETNSQGRQILSICIRLLDFVVNENKPMKREVLVDISDLQRKTGKMIADAICESFGKHKIKISDCKAQAYDNTSSMTSEKTGVYGEIRKLAPDAALQGCVLHSLNLVIAEACKIQTVVNMMGSCRELFSFFDNSPKRQNFLEVIIRALAPDTKKVKLKNLCKTRWIERHETFETLSQLYEYITITLEEICRPSKDERFYKEVRFLLLGFQIQIKCITNSYNIIL